MAAFGFSRSSVERIGQTVRDAEQGRIQKVNLGADSHDSAKPGVRLLIAKHEGGAWGTDRTAVVTIYGGDPGGDPIELASQATMVAYNHYIRFGEDPVCTTRWVALGHNGYNWVPVDSQDDCPSCDSEIGGIDFSVFVGFEKTQAQILGHDSLGCVRWYDVFTCSTAAT